MHLRMVFVSPDIATVRIVVEISSIHSTIISVNFGPNRKISKKIVSPFEADVSLGWTGLIEMDCFI